LKGRSRLFHEGFSRTKRTNVTGPQAALVTQINPESEGCLNWILTEG